MTTLLARVETSAEVEQVLAAGFDGVLVPAATDAAVRAGAVVAIVAPSDAGAETMTVTSGEGATSRLGCWRDRVPEPADLARLQAEGADGLLLRATGRVLDAGSIDGLAALAERCRAMRLTLALEGGLEPPDVPRLLAIGVDLLVVDDALRTSSGALDPARLAMLRDLVPRTAAMPRAAPAPETRGPVPPDRIFVRDLTLDIAIGAYASERGRLQRVRFAVEADLAGTGRPTRDMRDVVSYDLITDAIRQLTTGRHVEFVETLAEEIAGRVLAHPRVALVRVRVEKLDLGPGAVGVELVRAKG